MSDEKRMAGGYEILQAITIGDREIIEAGINADGDLYFGNEGSGYNLPDTPENRRYIEADIKRYTGKDVSLGNPSALATPTETTEEINQQGGAIMEMTFRPMLPAERNYSYSQSQQISMQTGCIGDLRGDMDTDGEGFFTTWYDFRKDLKTQEFKDEFDEVINALRFDEERGGVLKNLRSLTSYCYDHPEGGFDGNYCMEYGFRADTEKYAYLFRLNPTKGDNNLYCYCYVRDWLDKHLKQAERGIRFIDPNYTEKFRIPDGDTVLITTSDGEKIDRICRYIDDCHVEVGRNLYHIFEFAELVEKSDKTVIPLRSSLPEICYSVLPSSGELIVIKRGENGYFHSEYSTDDKAQNRLLADEQNIECGVSRAQEEAMLAGSMFGWDVQAADPNNYDDNGMPLRPKQRDGGNVR